MTMTIAKPNSTNGTTADLTALLDVLRAYGVARYKTAELELELGPMMPPRILDDFATTGVDLEDDGRFDHVAMRPRRMDDEVSE